MAPATARKPRRLAAAALLLLGPSVAAAAEATPGTALAALALPAPAVAAAPAPGWGAAYAAEGIGLRLSAGLPSRDAARHAAAALCRRDASACQPVGEFAGRCGAVAQSVDRAVLFAAARPLAPAALGVAVLGAGATEAEASQAALRACATTRFGAARHCLVVATVCGAG